MAPLAEGYFHTPFIPCVQRQKRQQDNGCCRSQLLTPLEGERLRCSTRQGATRRHQGPEDLKPLRQVQVKMSLWRAEFSSFFSRWTSEWRMTQRPAARLDGREKRKEAQALGHSAWQCRQGEGFLSVMATLQSVQGQNWSRVLASRWPEHRYLNNPIWKLSLHYHQGTQALVLLTLGSMDLNPDSPNLPQWDALGGIRSINKLEETYTPGPDLEETYTPRPDLTQKAMPICFTELTACNTCSTPY